MKGIIMNAKRSEYYIGLDIGTNSVGWAVANPDYTIPKFHGHKMWGSRLFDEAMTAEERRVHRTNRRRLNRRRDRLNILQDLFKDEIAQVDNTFFLRLKESKFYLEDKDEAIKDKNILFSDLKFTDKDFYKKYKTIYHLRNHLMNESPDDIRELYLAIHHILKYRGHFLLSGDLGISNESIADSLESIFVNLDILQPGEEFDLNLIDSILKNRDKTKSDRRKAVKKVAEEHWESNKKEQSVKNKIAQIDNIAGLALGLKADLSKLLNVPEYADLEKAYKEICFSKGDYEEKRGDYELSIGEYIKIIDQIKTVYDSIILSSVLKDYATISEAKIADYEAHQGDLQHLKKLLKPTPSLYNAMFRDDSNKSLNNYVAYIGAYTNGKRTSTEDFYKFVKKSLAELEDSVEKERVLNRIGLEQFMPLMRSKNNASIPYQIHKVELLQILEKAASKFPFLNDVKDGLSVKEKIIELFEFRIPYYVGPLNNSNSNNAWVIRKSTGKVYPWNFNEKIDEKASAEAFINNLTNKCTYLIGEDVLPKNSILYSKFSLLNELNNIRIDGQPLPVQVKQDYIDTIFKKEHKKQTKSRILDFLKTSGLIPNSIPVSVITGLDDSIKSDLKSYRDMEKILGEGFDISVAENIIRWVTLFGEAKRILVDKIRENYPQITDEQIKKIKKLKYSDWGKLSNKFLLKIKCITPEGDENSIIDTLENTNLNLMQILAIKSCQKNIELWNQEHTENKEYKTEYDLLDDLYISPAVKRSVWQSLKIVDELVRINGSIPKKIFVEVTRTNKAEKTKKDARQKRLLDLYQAIGKEGAEWKEQILNYNAGDFRSKKLYLYYTQMGRCMYSNELINIDRLFTNDYDIDHIFPRSVTKDNSWDNLVLVKSVENRKKTDTYPLPIELQNRNKEWWRMLRQYNFISERKYERLVRKEELTVEELSGFIARQLVETSQSTKAVTQLLKKIYPDTEIVFSKAENVSEFRDKNNFVKVRELNDYHHAKDAYLNIVVGNVYHEKFTKDPSNYIRNVYDRFNSINDRRKRLSMNHMFVHKLERHNTTIWDPSISMPIVIKMMESNDVRVTRKLTIQKGALYNASITKANKAKFDSNFPLKRGDQRLLDVSKYGGYENIYNAYYSVFRFIDTKLKKESVNLIAIPIYVLNSLNSNDDYILYVKSTISSRKNYDQIELLYKKLPINSLVRINGFDYYIGGKTNNNVCIDSAISVVLNSSDLLYLKSIIRVVNSDIPEHVFKMDDSLSKDANLRFYRSLVSKMKQSIFIKKSKNKFRELEQDSCICKFITLTEIEQCYVLLDLLNMLTNKKTTYDKLNKCLGVSMSRSTQGMNLSNLNEFIIKEQSVTGLYCKDVKLI